MFYLYQKDGSWRLKDQEHIQFMSQDEAMQACVQIAANSGLQEFDISVETQEPSFPSPYEQILGFQICNRCGLHPCEC